MQPLSSAQGPEARGLCYRVPGNLTPPDPFHPLAASHKSARLVRTEPLSAVPFGGTQASSVWFRLRFLVVGAVFGERVSARISLIYGKIQGKVANLLVIEQFERS